MTYPNVSRRQAGKSKMAEKLVRLEGVPSNQLFDILTDWNAQLQHTSIAENPIPANEDGAVLEIQESGGRHGK